MIDNYDIKSINGEEVLVLHLNFNYEFSSFNTKQEKHTFLEEVKEYLFDKKIDFKGTKIVLVIGGIALATLFLPISERKVDYNLYHNASIIENVSNVSQNIIPSDESEELETEIPSSEEVNEIQEKTDIPNNQSTNQSSVSTTAKSNNVNNTQIENSQPNIPTEPIVQEQTVTIYRTNGSVVTLAISDYLIGVVAAEMPASFSNEALKAQVIVARTYTLKKLSQGVRLTDSVSTQAYIDEREMKNLWGSSYSIYYNKIKSAVEGTKDLVLTYQGNYIEAVYHSTSNGKTESAQNVWGNYVPYLVSVDSPWDQSATSYLRTTEKELGVVLSVLGINETDLVNASISRNVSGRVETVAVGEKIYSGIDLRTMLGLRSTDFDLTVQNGNLVITTRGYGHGVGMSQYGANGMANAGYNYEQILKHYYTGVNLVQK